MKLIYNIDAKPKQIGYLRTILFAFQQLLAIMAATIAVPAIVGNGMSASAALFGAGVGTLIYQLFTKFKSPVFLGSSFAFIGSMVAAFAGSLSLVLAVLLIPGVQSVFSLTPMNAAAWGASLGLALVPLVVMEVYKLLSPFVKR